MASNFVFSSLTNGLVYVFNPIEDRITFDNPQLSASEVRVFESGGRAVFNSVIDNKLVGLALDQAGTPIVMANLTSTLVTFADGSLLRIGDNTISPSNDNSANTLIGGSKDDHLIGLGGNDTLNGGNGNDFLEGGSGNDRLAGGAGADVFRDSQGSNVFLGGAGDDFFFAQRLNSSTLDGGANTATGGDGSDTYYVNNSGFLYPVVDYTVTDFAVGAAGDLINVSNALAQMASSDFYQGGDPLSGGFIRVIQSGDDALVQADFTGTDTFGGFNTVLKLEDTNAEAAADRITGYEFGGTGNDTLTGDGSNTFLYGAAGNDVLNGGAGADNLFGGAGNDTYHVDNGGDAITEEAAGGGTDTVLSSVNYTLQNYVENLKLAGTLAKEGVGNTLANSITGNGLANLLKGGGGNDNINGGVGADSVQGGDGNDRMTWGAGDRLDGQAGTDTVKLAGNADLSLTALDNALIKAERIDMIGGSNTLTLNRADVLDLSTETNTITIVGDAADTVDIVGTFTAGVIANGFRTYLLGGGARLLVETDVNVI